MPGNYGLWDQTLALRFLHEVLPSFGGDPNQITLMGHSAGSSSVSALMYSPHSDREFYFQASRKRIKFFVTIVSRVHFF